MANIIAIIIILIIIGGALAYIIKAKKSGKKCIGCPNSCSCSAKDHSDSHSSCNGCCGCNDNQ